MGTEEVELEGIDYLRKFNERLYITMACISDGRDITEEDYAVLELVYRIYESGSLPFYHVICCESNDITSTQPDLFSEDTSET